MPRKQRIHYPGAIYHVITRGNKGNSVFQDNEDYRKYLLICKDYLHTFNVRVLAYALMSNHTHKLIQVNETPLSQFMKLLQQRYTQYYNKKYDTIGHVFQGRYKALIVRNESYLKKLISYIHLNPKSAGLEVNLGEYRWTGHHELVNKKRFILNDACLLKCFDYERTKALKEYIHLLNEISTFDPAEELCYENGERLENELREKKTFVLQEYALEELLAKVSLSYRIDPSLILSSSLKTRVVVSARRSFIYIARQYMRKTGIELAEFLKTSQEMIAMSYQDVVMGRHPIIKEQSHKIWNDMSNP